MSDTFQHFIDHLRLIRDREESELRRILGSQPELLAVATLLTDRLFRALRVVNNYECVLTGAGAIWPIIELDNTLCDAICAEFKAITGQDYKPSVQRTVEYREAQETK